MSVAADALSPREPGPSPAPDVAWMRLHHRTIVVDVVKGVLGLVPFLIAVVVFGAEIGSGELWPLAILAAVTLLGAVSDSVRWLFTSYRITPTHVELRTGVLVKAHRSMQRERIRSVDLEAKLRHRVAGLRVVKVGAGQHSVARESALRLDAVTRDDADVLRALLLPRAAGAAPVIDPAAVDEELAHGELPDLTELGSPADDGTVIARFQPGWFVYNMFSIWAYALALGLGWGAFWLLQSFGFDVGGAVQGLVERADLGAVGTGVVAVVIVGVLGAVGMGVQYFLEHWGFELSRVPGERGTLLRTRRGLFTTREVDREDARIRGVQISEPVLWRWLGVSDTTVITTGLSLWSMSAPAAVLPRGPVTEARRVAGAVLAVERNPMNETLRPHPRAALRRRRWWATWVASAVVAALSVLAVEDVVAWTVVVVAGVVVLLVGQLAAVVAYRALGHAVEPPFLVVRSGLFSRSTTALQTSAVSTVAVRESLFQRRLGLRTVSVMTSAGYGVYELPDLDADDAIAFAADVTHGLLDPFLEPEVDRTTR